MAFVNAFSMFRTQGLVATVMLRDEAGVRRSLPEVASWKDLQDNASPSVRIEALTLCCDFVRQDGNQAEADALLARLRQSAMAPRGVTYSIESLKGCTEIHHGARIQVTIAGAGIPEPLRHVAGWHGFKFETMRRLFQFRKPNSSAAAPLADEELHERIRHGLRSLTRRFV